MASAVAEAYMVVVLEVLRDMIDSQKWGSVAQNVSGSSSSTAHATNDKQQQQQGQQQVQVSGGSMGSSSLDPPEEYLLSVLRRYEPRMAHLFHSRLPSMASHSITEFVSKVQSTEMNTVAHKQQLTTALVRRLHASKVLDILLAVRGAVAQYILSGGGDSTSSSPATSPSAAESNFDKAGSAGGVQLVSSLAQAVFGASGRGLLRLIHDPSAARRCGALLDIIWMQSVFLALGELNEQPCWVGSPSAVNNPTNLSSPHPQSLTPEKVRTGAPSPGHSPVKEGSLTDFATSSLHPSCSTTIRELASVPLVFFLRRQHIYDIENLVSTWILRDVDVYPPYRRWIQHWSLEVLSLACGVDSSVAAPAVVALQDEIAERYSSESAVASGEPQHVLTFLALVAQESRVALRSIPPSAGQGPTAGGGASAALESDHPVILTSSITFVEKYIKGLLSILGDLSVYKNYAGLLKYARIVSSWRVESNSLLIALTSILVELAAACKGKKEVKAIFAEFCTRLLVPVAHTPHIRMDAWVFRNCEFLQMHHLSEWEGKAKYAPVVIPAVAAVLGCCSVPFFVRQVIPFCQLVARSLPDADRKMRGSFLFALQHVFGVCFRQVLTHHKLGADNAAAVLRRDLFQIVQTDIAANLRRTPLTNQSSRSVEAATELFLLMIQCFPVEGLTILLELLPPAVDGANHHNSTNSSSSSSSANALLFSEATAVALNTLGALSDVMFASDPANSTRATTATQHSTEDHQPSTTPFPQFRLAFQVWCGGIDNSSVPSKTMLDEDLLSGSALSFPCSPFCTIRRPYISCVTPSPLDEFGGDGCSPSASLFYASRESVSASWGSCVGQQQKGSAGGTGPSTSIFSEHLWDDELDAVCRRIGAPRLRWGVVFDPTQPQSSESPMPTVEKLVSSTSTVRLALEFLTSREEILLKRLSSILASLRDQLNVPPALKSAMRASGDTPTSSSYSAMFGIFASALSEKDKIAQRLLVATFLVSRYWAPTSAFLAEIPKALLHWNHSLVLATSAVVIPHYFVQKRFQVFVQPIIARFVEVAAASQDDRDTTMALAKALANMASLLRCCCAEDIHNSRHRIAPYSLSPPHPTPSHVKQYEAGVKWLLTVPSLPPVYYFAPPIVPSAGAVEMQTMSPLDMLDGVALVMLGNHDHVTRQSALSIHSDVVRMVGLMKSWRGLIHHQGSSAVDALPAASNAKGDSPLSSTVALHVDWDAYVCVGDSLVGAYGRDTLDECSKQIEDSQFVGCNWSDEHSKNLRLVSSCSCYSPPFPSGPSSPRSSTPPAAASPRESGNDRGASSRGIPRLLYTQAQDILRVHFVTDHHTEDAEYSSTVFSSNAVTFLQSLKSVPLPFVYSANITLDVVARAVWFSKHAAGGVANLSASTTIGISRAPLVAARMTSYICSLVGSGNFSSLVDSRYAMDAWRSAYSLFYTLIVCEAHPARRTLVASIQANAKPHTGIANKSSSSGAQQQQQQQQYSSTNGDIDPAVQDSQSSGNSWLIPDKNKKLSDLLQLTLTTLHRYSGVQDVFDVVSFVTSVILQRVLSSSLKDVVVLTPEFSRYHTDFVKKFLDDPVKSLARKDKKRALAYCAIACPTLLAVAMFISTPPPQVLFPLTAASSTSVPTQPNNSRHQSGHTSASGSAPPPTPHPSVHHHDVQLQAVKLFDAFDVLVSVLITGNFSSTVAGSNAPTSSSSVTFTPQQHELLKSGGVSSLAALSPIPSAKFVISHRTLMSSAVVPQPSPSNVSSYTSEVPWPLPSIVVDEVLGAPVLSAVVWSSGSGHPRGGSTASSPAGHSHISMDQSFSVRLRSCLVEMLGLFYQHELLFLPFLRERHRAMEEFLLFNVIGTPARNMTRALMDAQSLFYRMEDGFAMASGESDVVCPLISTRRTKVLPLRLGDPLLNFSCALRHLLTIVGFSSCGGSALDLIAPQRSTAVGSKATTVSNRNVHGGLQLLTRLFDLVLDTYLSNLSAWSKVTTMASSLSWLPMASPFAQHQQQGGSSASAPTATASGGSTIAYPFPSCFTDDSPFRECLVRIAVDASSSWAGQAFRLLYHRLLDASVGSPEYLFFAEAMLCFLNANPHLMLQGSSVACNQEDELPQRTPMTVTSTTTGAGRRKAHGHQLFREEASQPSPLTFLESPRGPLVVSTCLLLLGATAAGVNESLRRAADDLLRTIHRTAAPVVQHSTHYTNSSDRMHQWLNVLLHQHSSLFHTSRSRNQYNRLIEILLHRLGSQRLVRTPTWVGAHFSVLAKLLTMAELSEELFRSLIHVCRLHRSDVGDDSVGALFIAVDQSTPENQARISLAIMKLDDPEDLGFVLQFIRRYYTPPRKYTHPHAHHSEPSRRSSFLGHIGTSAAATDNLWVPVANDGAHSRSGTTVQRIVGQGIVFTLFCHCLKQLAQLQNIIAGNMSCVAPGGSFFAASSPPSQTGRSSPVASELGWSASPSSAAKSSAKATFVLLDECIWSAYLLRTSLSRQGNTPHHHTTTGGGGSHPGGSAAPPPPDPNSTRELLDSLLSPITATQDKAVQALVHFHELSASQRSVLQSIQGTVAKLGKHQGGSRPQASTDTLERCKLGLVMAATSPDVEMCLLKPLRSILNCFVSVAELLTKHRSLLCDAAAELGMGDKVPRNLYMKHREQTEQQKSRWHPPWNNGDGGAQSRDPECSMPLSQAPPPFASPAKQSPTAVNGKKRARHFSQLNRSETPGSSQQQLQRIASFPQSFRVDDDDDDSIMSNTSQATFLIHDDVAHNDPQQLPALLSSMSCMSQQDETSNQSKPPITTAPLHVNAKNWIVDESALERELLVLVSETMLLSVAHSLDILITSLVVSCEESVVVSSCVSCTRRRKLEGACIITAIRSLKSIVLLWHEAQLTRVAPEADQDRHCSNEGDMLSSLFSGTSTFSMTRSTESLMQLERQLHLFMEGHHQRPRADVADARHPHAPRGHHATLWLQLLAAALPLSINKLKMRDGLAFLQKHLPMFVGHWAGIQLTSHAESSTAPHIQDGSLVVARYVQFFCSSLVALFQLLSQSKELAEHERRGVSAFLLTPMFRHLLQAYNILDVALLNQNRNATSQHRLGSAVLKLVSRSLHDALGAMFRVVHPASSSLSAIPASAQQLLQTEHILSEHEVLQCLWGSIAVVVCGGGEPSEGVAASSASSNSLWWNIQGKVDVTATILQRGCLAGGLSISLIPKCLKIRAERGGSPSRHPGYLPSPLSVDHLRTLRRMTPECVFVVGCVLRVLEGGETITSGGEQQDRNGGTQLDLTATRIGLARLLEAVSGVHVKVAPFLAALFALLLPDASAAHLTSATPSSPFACAVRGLLPNDDAADSSFGMNFVSLCALLFGPTIDEYFTADSPRDSMHTPWETRAKGGVPSARWSTSPPDCDLAAPASAMLQRSPSSLEEGAIHDFEERLSQFLIAPVVWLLSSARCDHRSTLFSRALLACNKLLAHPRLGNTVLHLLGETVADRLHDALDSMQYVVGNHSMHSLDDWGSSTKSCSEVRLVVCSRLAAFLSRSKTPRGEGQDSHFMLSSSPDGDCHNAVGDAVALLDHMYNNSVVADAVLASSTSSARSATEAAIPTSPLGGGIYASNEAEDFAMLRPVGDSDEENIKKHASIKLCSDPGKEAVGDQNAEVFQLDWWPDVPNAENSAHLAPAHIRPIDLEEVERHNEDFAGGFSPARHGHPPPLHLDENLSSSPSRRQSLQQQQSTPSRDGEGTIRPMYTFSLPYIFAEEDDPVADKDPLKASFGLTTNHRRTCLPDIIDHLRGARRSYLVPTSLVAETIAVLGPPSLVVSVEEREADQRSPGNLQRGAQSLPSTTMNGEGGAS